MSGRSFGSLFMVASCATAALGCYLVSLRVASERAALESVETQIVLAQRDLRVLQTEIGTRGRLSQLERWNAGAFALSAPSAHQFVGGGFELARLTQPQRDVNFEAPVVLASAPAPEHQAFASAEAEEASELQAAAPATAPTKQLLREASYKTETREVPARAVAKMPPEAAPKSTDKPATAVKPAPLKLADRLAKSADRPGLAAAKSKPPASASAKLADASKAAAKKSVDKGPAASAKPVTKPVRIAKADPLAPLADKQSGKTKGSSTGR